MESKGNVRERATRAALAAVAAGAMLTACSQGGGKSAPKAPVDHCSTENQRPLPAAANVGSYKDSRSGWVYPCWYMMDMDLPFNKPTQLGKVTESSFANTQITSRSSYGGWLFFGVGNIHGSSNSSQTTTQKDVYAMEVIGSDGAYQKIVVDSEKVRLKPCNDNCEPTVTMNVNGQSLFYMYNHESIWHSKDPQSETWKRYNTVAAVSNLLPREQVVGDVLGSGSVSGGPRMPGEVVSALATSVVVTMPAKYINNPTTVK